MLDLGPQWLDRVALLTEGVGRNGSLDDDPAGIDVSPSSRRAWVEILAVVLKDPDYTVALLAEGVGRNWDDFADWIEAQSSPSSRRAWVEIEGPFCISLARCVALLAEGVGRNWFV